MLTFRQINDLIGAAIEGEQNDLNKLRWIVNYERAGMNWDEFTQNLQKANKKEKKQTKEEVLADIEKMMQGLTFV